MKTKPKKSVKPGDISSHQSGTSFCFVETIHIVILILLVAFIWCYTRDRMTADSWYIPVQYDSDAPQILGWIKAASEGDYVPFGTANVHRLGAPYTADWNDYPMYEKIVTYIMGLAARMFGLIWAANFGMLLGHLTSAVSFYACCRLLRQSRVWSFVGAVLFAFVFYNTYRALGHLLLAYSYTLPFAVVSSWLIASSQRLRRGNRFYWLCLATAVVMGLSSPYNLNMYLQLLCLGVLIQCLTQRRPENIKTGLLSLALVVISFLAINAGTIYYQWQHGRNGDAVLRYYFEAELNALKPIELIMPSPAHHLKAFADLGFYYLHKVWSRGEIFSAYQGVIGIIGLVWLFTDAVRWIILRNNPARRIPAPALQISWIVLYSLAGGFNCLVSLFGILYFRGSNRYSIFISAITLLFLVSKMSRLSRLKNWPPVFNFSLAALVLGIGLFDQLPTRPERAETARLAAMIGVDRDFGRDMEASLAPGSMVFEMPVMGFPEGKPIGGVTAYDLMRPYLFTKTLRFSFGSVHGRPRETWQMEVQRMDVMEIVQTLERYGFAAIYLNRKVTTDQAIEFTKKMAAAGRGRYIEDASHENCCFFSPAFRHAGTSPHR